MWNIDEETKTMLAKPVASGVIAGAIDRYWFANPYLNQNLTFSGVVAVSVLVADIAAKKTHVDVISKSIEARVLEIGIASTVALGLDFYVTPSQIRRGAMDRLTSVVVAEVAGEYVANSFLGFA